MDEIEASPERSIDPQFDLLCLQEDEYYFRDYPCHFSVLAPAATDDDDSASVASAVLKPGVLKLCSSSVYLVPEETDDAIVRIPLDFIASALDPSSSEDSKPTDISCTIQTSTTISIQSGPRAVPYFTRSAPSERMFSANLKFQNLANGGQIDFLPKLQQLWTISKSRTGGTEQECRATEQVHALVEAYEAGVDFDSTPLKTAETQTGEEILVKLRGFRVSPLLIQPGFIVLSHTSIYFQPYSCLPASAATGTQQWRLKDANLKYGKRKFMLKDVALELFFDDKTEDSTLESSSLFVAFKSVEDKNAFQKVLLEKTRVASCSPATGPSSLSQITKEWTRGKISNYEYLAQLNEFAGRSFNDLTQYPVFPWVVQDYSSTVLDLQNPSTFRDLSKPIAALNPARVRHAREMYAALQSAQAADDPPWMYGSHYSNPGLVVFYLLRQHPQLMLRLQNGKFDAPDRLFSSISGAWESVLRWNSDVKELIPEFYTPLPTKTTGEQGQNRPFLINSTGTDFGRRASGELVNDVDLPPWASNPEDFITKMRAALESPLVSAKLHKWVDLIFGVKQRGSKAVAADNVFHYMTDDETALRYIEGEKDVALRSAFEAQIREYGRTPTQLFTKKHPKCKGQSRIAGLLQACTCAGPVSGAAGEQTSQSVQPSRRIMVVKATSSDPAFLGIDFGTSGARCFVVSESGDTLCSTRAAYSSSEPEELGSAWETALFELIEAIPSDLKPSITCLAIDGTSSTTLLIDADTGKLLVPPKMYNEAQEPHIVQRVKEMAPPGHTVTASSSTLCKVLTWDEAGIWQAAAAEGKTPLVLHQCDWLASLLHGYRNGVTDWNNALKLGFDPGNCEYPDFIIDQDFASILPPVVCAPGTPLAPITPEIATKTGLSNDCIVCAGTTDSIAATLAAGISEPGQAVTSLGSTLAIKLFSETRADDAAYGVYSHRIGDVWLVGGASNTGGAVLRKYFSDAELKALTPKMDPSRATGLTYTVLPKKGERFPLNDPEMEPCLEPRPENDAVFLQGMLEAMAATEAAAYRKLTELGATPVKEILTAGGGAANPVWTELRRKAIGVPVKAAVNGEAAYGAAILARQGYEVMKLEKAPLLL